MRSFLTTVEKQTLTIENYKILILIIFIVFAIIINCTIWFFMNQNIRDLYDSNKIYKNQISKMSNSLKQSDMKYQTLNIDFQVLSNKIGQIVENINTNNFYQVKVTYYVPNLKGINSDSNPSKTAIMTKPIPGYTVALSSDLVEAGWLGQKIYIDGLGVFKAEDRMSRSIVGKHIDICVGDLKTALKLTPKYPKLAIKL